MPLSASGELAPLERVPSVHLAALDRDILLAEDAGRQAPGVAPRFAIPHEVSLDPTSAGLWERTADGRDIWRLRVVAEKAVSIKLGFTRFHLPEGAHLQVFGQDGKNVVRPFTARDNHPQRELWTPVIRGDEVVIELVTTPEARGEIQLLLGSINYGYRGFFEPAGTRSGSCNVDVVCPEGEGWEDQIASVAVISTGGGTFCTGFMVNNAESDDTPFFMTAAHCGINSGNAPSLVAYWNFENSYCRIPNTGDSGGVGDGNLNQFTTGAMWRAGYGGSGSSDFTLVEFNNEPDEEFGVFYAGWDVRDQATSSAIAVHHPSTNEKRISFEFDPTTITNYLSGTVTPTGTHVRVADWDVGTTEPGSSGSPLFSPEGRVIGQLHGGYAACGNNLDDWYGRMFVSWDRAGSTSSNRLRDWLDPQNTGVQYIDGKPQGDLNPTFELTLEPAMISACSGDPAETDVLVRARWEFDDLVTLGVDGLEDGLAADFSTNPVLPEDPAAVVALTLSGTAGASGLYDLLVTGDSSGPGFDPISLATPLQLLVTGDVPGMTAITSPSDNAVGVSVSPTITWAAADEAVAYELEIALDAGFTSVVYSHTGNATSHELESPLDTNSTYFVRVQAANDCGESDWSGTISFTTEALPGDCPMGTVATSLLSENFDGGSLPAGWSTAGSSGAVTWVTSTVQTHSGSHSVFAQNVAAVTDQRLATPSISLPDDAVSLFLNFQNWQSIESSSDGCWDGGLLEVSTNGGSTWQQVTNEHILVREYDGTIGTGWGNPLDGMPGWCGDPRDSWERYSVNLENWAGQDVQFRFRFGSDSSVSRVGWYVDSVDVHACTEDKRPPEIFHDRFEAPE